MPDALPAPEQITPRDLVSDRDLRAHITCERCRTTVQFDVWRLHSGRVDTPIAWMRFACARCRTPALGLRIVRVDPRGGLQTDVCLILLTGPPNAGITPRSADSTGG